MAYFLSAVMLWNCTGVIRISHEEMLELETRDENSPVKMVIRFDRVMIGLRDDSLRIGGQVFTPDHKSIPYVHVQFGIWKTAEEGSYFIIRKEFLSDSAGNFDIRTDILNDEWMVFESEAETRFFSISSVKDKTGN